MNTTRLVRVVATLILLGAAVIMSCADPLENLPESPISGPVIIHDSIIDTIEIIDTINVGDSVIYDTVLIIDTVIVSDSMIIDTVIITDTIVDTDTVTIIDTLNYTDTLVFTDTLVITDTFNYTDTLIVIDTVGVIDTVVVIDTVPGTDTIVVTDTVTETITDTIIEVDTLTLIDTVIVNVPDSTPPTWLCSRLASNQQEVIWILRNEPGRYRLNFDAVTERDQPSQSVTIDIDGTEYVWPVGQDKDHVIELDLDGHSIVTITSNVPPARGHSIDICLTITAL